MRHQTNRDRCSTATAAPPRKSSIQGDISPTATVAPPRQQSHSDSSLTAEKKLPEVWIRIHGSAMSALMGAMEQPVKISEALTEVWISPRHCQTCHPVEIGEALTEVWIRPRHCRTHQKGPFTRRWNKTCPSSKGSASTFKGYRLNRRHAVAR